MKPYPTTPKGLNGTSLSSSEAARKPNKPLSVASKLSSSVLIVASMDRCDDATRATIAGLRPAGETSARRQRPRHGRTAEQRDETPLFLLRPRGLQLGSDRRSRLRRFLHTGNERLPQRLRALRPPRPRVLLRTGGERAQPSRRRRRLAWCACGNSGEWQARVNFGEAAVPFDVPAPPDDAVGERNAGLPTHEFTHLEAPGALATHIESAQSPSGAGNTR